MDCIILREALEQVPYCQYYPQKDASGLTRYLLDKAGIVTIFGAEELELTILIELFFNIVANIVSHQIF